jgi:co-chaperonin GroES (HSP10)
MSDVVQLRKNTEADGFPVADPMAEPFGERVLVQLRMAKKMTVGGILLPDETKDQEKWITTIAKVIAIGPLAFRDRETMLPWPEGIWAKPGDYVRVPKWGGDRWEVPLGDRSDRENVARFAIFRDKELIARITGDPMQFTDYV